MFYRVRFAEFNIHAENQYQLKKIINIFKKNEITPKIIDIEEQTKEEYLERIIADREKEKRTAKMQEKNKE